MACCAFPSRMITVDQNVQCGKVGGLALQGGFSHLLRFLQIAFGKFGLGTEQFGRRLVWIRVRQPLRFS